MAGSWQTYIDLLMASRLDHLDWRSVSFEDYEETKSILTIDYEYLRGDEVYSYDRLWIFTRRRSLFLRSIMDIYEEKKSSSLFSRSIMDIYEEKKSILTIDYGYRGRSSHNILLNDAEDGNILGWASMRKNGEYEIHVGNLKAIILPSTVWIWASSWDLEIEFEDPGERSVKRTRGASIHFSVGMRL
jgi:hypothetical protein